MPASFVWAIFFVVLFVGFYSIFYNNQPNFWAFLIGVSFSIVIAILWSDSSFLYRLGKYEYVVRDGSIITSATRREVRITKPEGEIRSFRPIEKGLTWQPLNPDLPARKIVVVARGSPELAERFYALKDSVSDPFKQLQVEVRYSSYCSQALQKSLLFFPAIRLKNPHEKASFCAGSDTKESDK